MARHILLVCCSNSYNIIVQQYISWNCLHFAYPPLNPTGPENLSPPFLIPPQPHPTPILYLLTRDRTASHIHLLRRRAGRDVEVEDIHGKTERHACVRDLYMRDYSASILNVCFDLFWRKGRRNWGRVSLA